MLTTFLVSARADSGPAPISHPATTAVAASSSPPKPRPPGPPATPTPCAASDCISHPSPYGKPQSSAEPATSTLGLGGGGAPGGITGWIAKGITSALNSFFRGIVDAALNPLLDLLGRTLLTTPTPSSLPRLGELWESSWQIAIACYALLVSAAGVVVMAHGTVQTRYSIKELAPRIPLGFLIAGLSLFLAGKAIDLANALSVAVMGDGLDTGTAATALSTFVFAALNANTGSVFFVLIGFAIAGTLAALLVGYVVRLALTVILIAGAPLALICHVLPQTEGVARWWWKAFGGVLAIQVVQSLALITALRLFLTPSGFTAFGRGHSGLVDLLVALALFYILLKIPFWILGSLRGNRGRSFIGGLVRAFVLYRTFGALRGVTGRTGGGNSGGGSGPAPFTGGPNGPSNSPTPSGVSPAAAMRRTREASRLPRPNSSGASGRGSRLAPRPPSFLAPTPASPTGGGNPSHPDSGPPRLPSFRSPGEPAVPDSRANASAQSWPRPGGPPGPPLFRAPVFPEPVLPGQRPSGVTGPHAGAGMRPPGVWPNSPTAGRPTRSHTPPAPTTFRSPVPENTGGVRPLPQRTAPPHPTTFRASPPPSTPRPTPPSSRRLPPPPTNTPHRPRGETS
ncbi:hypothetical protein [Streptomyces fractus]|uniref:hypothetical protein n=1 Tax=Streptomyces fractus TaxID=641806 RepID=UPI003CF46F6C